MKTTSWPGSYRSIKLSKFVHAFDTERSLDRSIVMHGRGSYRIWRRSLQTE